MPTEVFSTWVNPQNDICPQLLMQSVQVCCKKISSLCPLPHFVFSPLHSHTCFGSMSYKFGACYEYQGYVTCYLLCYATLKKYFFLLGGARSILPGMLYPCPHGTCNMEVMGAQCDKVKKKWGQKADLREKYCINNYGQICCQGF